MNLKTGRNLSIVLLMTAAFLHAAPDSTIYKHPALEFSFQETPGWKQVRHPEDNMIYEFVSPEEDMHVMLWYTATMQDGRGYLLKMADMKGFRVDSEPDPIASEKGSGWRLKTEGEINGRSSVVILQVNHRGYDAKYKDHYALYISMVWWGLKDNDRVEKRMQIVLDRIRIGKVEAAGRDGL